MGPRQLSFDLFPRHAAALVSAALADTRVVVLNGARQVGKSTLAQLTVDQRSDDAKAYYLDEEPVRAAAAADPIGFLHHDGLLMIDEIQRVPELLLAIKREVDRDPRPGRFLHTGSARLWGLRGIPDTLPGRSETIELWPLAQGELCGGPDGFVDAVLERASGEIVGIEVKAAETVRAEDFRGLRRLADQIGDRFHAGYVLYAGAEVLPFGPRMRAVPISALWTTPSTAGTAV